MSPYRNVSKYTSAKFHVHRVSRMRRYIISLRSYGSSVLQLAGLCVVGGRLALYSCSQFCMLLACINLYCNHQVLAQLLHHFLLYICCPLANNVQHSASIRAYGPKGRTSEGTVIQLSFSTWESSI